MSNFENLNVSCVSKEDERSQILGGKDFGPICAYLFIYFVPLISTSEVPSIVYNLVSLNLSSCYVFNNI